jgi:hypothetical protein
LGEGHLAAEMRVTNLVLDVNEIPQSVQGEKEYSNVFYPASTSRKLPKPLAKNLLVATNTKSEIGTGAVEINFCDRIGSHKDPVALLTNQLLRSMGYSVKLADLRALL